MIKQRWLFFVIFALSCMGVINAILVRTAIHSALPAIDEDAYDHGMDYEKDITAMQNAKNAGINFTLAHLENGSDVLTVEGSDEIVATLKECQLHLIRPSNASLDRTEKVDLQAKTTKFPTPLEPGLWLVELTGHFDSGDRILIKKKIIL